MRQEFAKWVIKTSVFSGRKPQAGNYCVRCNIAFAEGHQGPTNQSLDRRQ
jgi:hypothetical protein